MYSNSLEAMHPPSLEVRTFSWTVFFHPICDRNGSAPITKDQAIDCGLYPSTLTFASLLEVALDLSDQESAECFYQGLLATPGQSPVACRDSWACGC